MGTGIGALLADTIPLLPSGARRAGAAKVMAARVGHDPSFLVEHPIKTQLLAAGLGGALSPFVRDQHTGVRAATALGPLVLVQLLRRRELRKIQRKYDTEKRKRLSELDQEELFDNGVLGFGGSSRLGAVNAYETMRARKYKGFGSLAEAGDALQLAAGAVSPALYSGSIPLISAIDNRAAARLLGKKASDEPKSLLANLATSVPVGAFVGTAGTSAVLAAAALAARKKSPALSKLLSGAAKDGLAVFDPRMLWRLSRATPEAARLFDKEMALLRAAERYGGRGDLPADALAALGGSDELSKNKKALQAFMAKYKTSPSDVMQEAVGGISGLASAGAGAALAGITGLQNHFSNPADRRHIIKTAEFADQRESPSLPLYLAAAALSSAGLTAAGHWAHKENTNTPALGPGRWNDTVQAISGSAPLLFGTEGVGNAFFYKPRSDFEAAQFLRETNGLADHTGGLAQLNSILGGQQEKLRRLKQYGAIVADSTAGAPTIAHEAGHAKIEETPGILRALQRHVYPHSRWLAPLAGAGSLAAGLSSGGIGKGALIGTGIGALAGLGMVGPEMGASYHALKHLGGGKLSGEATKDLLSALSTYLAATVLPSTLAGAAGGFISGRRRKREEEGEGREKAASAYTISGDQTQGIGLRKTYHQLLEELGHDGLAVNNPHTDEVELTVDAPDPEAVLVELVRRIKAQKGKDITYAKAEKTEPLQKLTVDPDTLEKLRHAHFQAYLRSEMFDPTDADIIPPDRHKADLIERYRLKETPEGGLEGNVPERAMLQLTGKEMPYSWMQKVATDQDLHLLSYVPDDALESVREHGLLSGDELARPENRAMLELARGDQADAWLAEREANLKDKPWLSSYAGPSFFFGEPDSSKFGDDHPLKRRKSSPVRIKLGELLRDLPDTRLHGVELAPYAETAGKYSDDEWAALSESARDAVINKRHRDITLEDVAKLVAQAQNPEDFWRHFKPGDGKYAGDVPHVQIITPGGKGIPAKYLEFDDSTRTSTHTKTLPDGSKIDVLKLIELLKDREVEEVDLNSLDAPKNKERKTGFSEKRYREADISYPLIVDQNRSLLDGRHRYFKIRDGGGTFARVRTATPEDIEAVRMAKSAALDPVAAWKILDRANKLRKQMSVGWADRQTMEHMDAPFQVAMRRFFKDPRVKALGLSPRTPSGKIAEALKNLKVNLPAQPAAPDGPLIQGTFDFMKEARRHPALPGLLQAKEHSDAGDYRQKGLLLRQMMDENPGDWVIDSDDGKGIVGVTHVPTGFRIHTRRAQLPPSLSGGQ